MLTIAAIITWIASAGKFLKETGGDATVKEGAKSVFSWLKEKFTKKSEQVKIEEMEKNPDNQEAIEELKTFLKDLQTDDEQRYNELVTQIKIFETVVQEKMPSTAEEINHNINSNIISNTTVHGNITQGHTYHYNKEDK